MERQKLQNTRKGDFIFKEESYQILGAAFEVYRELGCGFLEGVYQESLELEMRARSIPFVRHPEFKILYKGIELRRSYEPDFLCHGSIILELKAVSALDPFHRAQLHNYLKAAGLPLGYLLNFGHYPKIEFERIVRTTYKPPPTVLPRT